MNVHVCQLVHDPIILHAISYYTPGHPDYSKFIYAYKIGGEQPEVSVIHPQKAKSSNPSPFLYPRLEIARNCETHQGIMMPYPQS